ncbi:MAG: tRNA (adenosine(37)-N6)-threonylcarbamoyltransferase complex ATPase subunit type 1 TsaE [Gemmatimonadota bacterium]|nr:tRNA (adenosine(37)-N6)-threonylcarbamoyltransferase complex ATPase subunit type 1 TsaE [Gemmatimonadota bacterium]
MIQEPGTVREVSATCLDLERLCRWGRELGRLAVRHRVFVALDGPLGAGKTTLVQACCDGADVAGPVTSPTFTLVQRYGDAPPVHHVDLYRIGREDELRELGWDDLTAGDGPVFVEWAARAGTRLPDDRWEVRLEIPAGGECRGVHAIAHGRAPALPEIEVGP